MKGVNYTAQELKIFRVEHLVHATISVSPDYQDDGYTSGYIDMIKSIFLQSFIFLPRL